MRRLIIGLAALVVLAGVGQAWGAIAGNTLVVPEPSAFTLLGIGFIVFLASARRMNIPLTRNGFLFSLVISLAVALPVVADTTVGGFVDSDTHWMAAGSPYIATQSVVITNGATLTIDPGVEIRFDPLKALSVAAGQPIARDWHKRELRRSTGLLWSPKAETGKKGQVLGKRLYQAYQWAEEEIAEKGNIGGIDMPPKPEPALPKPKELPPSPKPKRKAKPKPPRKSSLKFGKGWWKRI